MKEAVGREKGKWRNTPQFNEKKIHNKKTNSPKRKMSKNINRHFSKKDIQMTNKHRKEYSALLVISEMKSQTTMRYCFTPSKMFIIKKIK